jgi:hypothetical protein
MVPGNGVLRIEYDKACALSTRLQTEACGTFDGFRRLMPGSAEGLSIANSKLSG